MTTTTPSTDVAVTDSMFSEGEPFALADSSPATAARPVTPTPLDQRQFVTWCQSHNLRLLDVRCDDIESSPATSKN